MSSHQQQRQMNDYWHIPRASLSPSSTSSAVSSASSTQRSNRSQNKRNVSPAESRQQQQRQPQHHQQQQTVMTNIRGSEGRRWSEMSSNTSAAATAAAAAAVLAAAKRGSRSSQGSSDSNNSTRSVASGSLLLTAANLERMAEIYKKGHEEHHQAGDPHLPSSTYNANLVEVLQHQHNNSRHFVPEEPHEDQTQRDAVINIDPNLNFIKTKDLDTVSVASSMHFTMVNGEAGANKKTKKGLCDRGRQVTVLIVTMSTIFLLLIIGMVYALEMRAREMPQS